MKTFEYSKRKKKIFLKKQNSSCQTVSSNSKGTNNFSKKKQLHDETTSLGSYAENLLTECTNKDQYGIIVKQPFVQGRKTLQNTKNTFPNIITDSSQCASEVHKKMFYDHIEILEHCYRNENCITNQIQHSNQFLNCFTRNNGFGSIKDLHIWDFSYGGISPFSKHSMGTIHSNVFTNKNVQTQKNASSRNLYNKYIYNNVDPPFNISKSQTRHNDDRRSDSYDTNVRGSNKSYFENNSKYQIEKLHLPPLIINQSNNSNTINLKRKVCGIEPSSSKKRKLNTQANEITNYFTAVSEKNNYSSFEDNKLIDKKQHIENTIKSTEAFGIESIVGYNMHTTRAVDKSNSDYKYQNVKEDNTTQKYSSEIVDLVSNDEYSDDDITRNYNVNNISGTEDEESKEYASPNTIGSNNAITVSDTEDEESKEYATLSSCESDNAITISDTEGEEEPNECSSLDNSRNDYEIIISDSEDEEPKECASFNSTEINNVIPISDTEDEELKECSSFKMINGNDNAVHVIKQNYNERDIIRRNLAKRQKAMDTEIEDSACGDNSPTVSCHLNKRAKLTHYSLDSGKECSKKCHSNKMIHVNSNEVKVTENGNLNKNFNSEDNCNIASINIDILSSDNDEEKESPFVFHSNENKHSLTVVNSSKNISSESNFNNNIEIVNLDSDEESSSESKSNMTPANKNKNMDNKVGSRNFEGKSIWSCETKNEDSLSHKNIPEFESLNKTTWLTDIVIIEIKNGNKNKDLNINMNEQSLGDIKLKSSVFNIIENSSKITGKNSPKGFLYNSKPISVEISNEVGDINVNSRDEVVPVNIIQSSDSNINYNSNIMPCNTKENAIDFDSNNEGKLMDSRTENEVDLNIVVECSSRKSEESLDLENIDSIKLVNEDCLDEINGCNQFNGDLEIIDSPNIEVLEQRNSNYGSNFIESIIMNTNSIDHMESKKTNIEHKASNYSNPSTIQEYELSNLQILEAIKGHGISSSEAGEKYRFCNSVIEECNAPDSPTKPVEKSKLFKLQSVEEHNQSIIEVIGKCEISNLPIVEPIKEHEVPNSSDKEPGKKNEICKSPFIEPVRTYEAPESSITVSVEKYPVTHSTPLKEVEKYNTPIEVEGECEVHTSCSTELLEDYYASLLTKTAGLEISNSYISDSEKYVEFQSLTTDPVEGFFTSNYGISKTVTQHEISNSTIPEPEEKYDESKPPLIKPVEEHCILNCGSSKTIDQHEISKESSIPKQKYEESSSKSQCLNRSNCETLKSAFRKIIQHDNKNMLGSEFEKDTFSDKHINKSGVVKSEVLIASYKSVMTKHHDSAARHMGIWNTSFCTEDPYLCSHFHKNVQESVCEVCDTKENMLESFMEGKNWINAFLFCDYIITKERTYPSSKAVLLILDFILNTHEDNLIDSAVSIFKKIIAHFPPCNPSMLQYYESILTGNLGKKSISTNGVLFDVISKINALFLNDLEDSDHTDKEHSEEETDIDSFLNKENICSESLDAYADFELEYKYLNYYESIEAKKNYHSLPHCTKVDRLFIVLELLVELMEIDLSVFLVKRSFKLRTALCSQSWRPLIATIWRRTSNACGIGCLNTTCKIIIDLYIKCFSLNIEFWKRKVISRLLNLIAEVVQASEINDDLHYPFFQRNCYDFAKELYLSIKGLNPDTKITLLTEMMPSYLTLFISIDLLCDVFDIPKKNPPSLDVLISVNERNDELSSEPTTSETLNMKNVNKRDKRGETRLHLVCRRNRVDELKMLLRNPNIDVNAEDNLGWTPLHEAVSHGSLKCLEELLRYKPPIGKKKIRISARNKDGITPLLDAVQNNQLASCKLLLKYGGSSILRNSYGMLDRDLINVACSSEMKELLNAAISSGMNQLFENSFIEKEFSKSRSGNGGKNCSLLGFEEGYSWHLNTPHFEKNHIPLLFLVISSFMDMYQIPEIIHNIKTCIVDTRPKNKSVKGRPKLKFDYQKFLKDYSDIRFLRKIIKKHRTKNPENCIFHQLLLLL